MSTSRRKLIGRHGRPVVTGLALAAYLLSVVGYPLPLVASKDTATPFPCQSRQCGCQSAGQCWESCCCHSPEERLAWARRHGVHVPGEVRAKMVSRACQRHQVSQGAACCTSDENRAAADHDGCDACRRESAGGKRGFVFGFQAQQCQGLTTMWIAGGVTLSVAIPAWEFAWVPLGRVCPTACTFSTSLDCPPVPPPRADVGSAVFC